MSRENQPENAVVVYEPQPETPPLKQEGYWGRVSARFLLLKRIFVIALILFAVFFILCFSRAFTSDSLFSFFKDLQSVGDFIPSDYQTVSATYREGAEIALSYRGSIAFVNTKGIEIYSPDGGRLLDVEEDFATPRALTSRKYLLVYDHGGSKLTVTNAYAELFSESFQNMPRYNSKGEEIGEVDLQILGASLADSGHFAVITTSNRANQLSLVWLYDNNFNLIQCFGRGSATLGVTLSPNGSRVAILGADAQSGEPLAKVDIFSFGATKPDESLALQGEVPLSISFVTNQSIALLTNKTLYFLNNRLEIKESVSLEGRAIVGFAANGEGVALALEENALTATKRLMSFTTDGKELLNTAFVGEIGAMSLYDRTLFLLSDRSVIRFVGDSDEAERLEIPAGAYDIFAVSARGVRVVYPAKADYLKFD
ncbi:MAG: hypothetical protein IKD28_00325 [Clostridia bacterium]|nr:hypothetical protein [Clostridia bacterium]